MGSRIYKGLGDLGNLDATQPKTKAARTEKAAAPSSSAAAEASSSNALTSPTAPPSISAGVFGTWEEWRSVFRTLFPTPNPTSASLPESFRAATAMGAAAADSSSGEASNDVAAARQKEATALRAVLNRLDALDSKAMQGLALIDIWRLRARNGGAYGSSGSGSGGSGYPSSPTSPSSSSAARVPRYVEATAVLAEAQMMDRAMIKAELYAKLEALTTSSKSAAAPSSPSSSLNLNNFVGPSNPLAVVRPSVVANSYGGAISRALHILTGGLIRSGSFVDEESSYRSRARDIGLPEEAVEARRRVAHGNMPLLSELRLTTALVVEHLHDRYWALQESQVRRLLREDERDAKRRAREDGVEYTALPSSVSNNKNNKNSKGKGKKGQLQKVAVAEEAPKQKSVAASDVMALLAELSGDDDDDAGDAGSAAEGSDGDDDIFVEGV